jgi:hypothetical protein
MVGQVRAYAMGLDTNINDVRLEEFMKQFRQYEAKNTAAWNEYVKQQGNAATTTNLTPGTEEYNKQNLGLKYDDSGKIKAPFAKEAPKQAPQPAGLTCEDGTSPDADGCCAGEVYTDMGEQGFNCCPSAGGDCFPPIK